MQKQSNLSFIFLILACSPAAAIVTSDASGTHVVQSGAITFGMNLDGVVHLSGWASGVLIADRYILTAAHVTDIDLDGVLDKTEWVDSARFELPEGDVVIPLLFHEARLAPDWAANPGFGRGDLAIIPLAVDAPAAAPRYALNAVPDEIGKQTVIAGYGWQGHGATGLANIFDATKRAGLNRIEARSEDVMDEEWRDGRNPLPGATMLFDFDSAQPVNNTLAALGIVSDLGFGDDEVGIAIGDSGGALFIDGVLSGVIHGYTGGFDTDITPDESDGSWGEVGTAIRVSSFQEFITTATNGEAVFVPEPSTWALAACALFAGGLLSRRRRILRRPSGP